SLARRETNLMIVGGVNLILSPEVSIILSQGGMLSPVGRCKVFDAAADGYVRSEGCAVVTLKRLHEALTDGDNVLAVVRGTAVNQDGRTHSLTVTSAAAQQAVIDEALNCAGVAAADVSYVEVHTPGTPLMDILELRALKAVLLGPRPAMFGPVANAAAMQESARLVLAARTRISSWRKPRQSHRQPSRSAAPIIY